jgi:hypothetical protein
VSKEMENEPIILVVRFSMLLFILNRENQLKLVFFGGTFFNFLSIKSTFFNPNKRQF